MSNMVKLAYDSCNHEKSNERRIAKNGRVFMALNNKDIILDISVNLARVSEFILDKRERLVNMFLDQTAKYLSDISEDSISVNFKPTLFRFKQDFKKLVEDRYQVDKEEWAERALTWANILQHRAKLA